MQPLKQPKTRFVRRALIALLGLLTLIAIVWTEENWRGRRAWENYKAEEEAKGERFDLASFAPKPVPPEQNFAATPFLAPLLDFQMVNGEVHWNDSNGVARAKSVTMNVNSLGNWQKAEFCDLAAAQKALRSDPNFPANSQPQDASHDILFALQKFEPVLTELRTASRRPYSVYSSLGPDDNAGVMVDYLTVLRSLTRTTVLRALAELETGNSDQALADVKLAIHLGQSPRLDPLLIQQMMRIAILNLSLQPVWEGLARHRWNAAQLEELQKILSSMDFLADYGFTMRGERAFSNEIMSRYVTGGFAPGSPASGTVRFLAPRGLFYQNRIVINQLHQQFTFPAVDAAAHRVYPEKCDPDAIARALGRRTPYNMLVYHLHPAYHRVAEIFAVCQTSFDEATIACALERYRLAHNQYPASLDALTPQFLDKLPHDVFTGQPLVYRLAGSGQFTLYSVGWNGKDDGGTVSLKKNGGIEWKNGDWVWRYPEK